MLKRIGLALILLVVLLVLAPASVEAGDPLLPPEIVSARTQNSKTYQLSDDTRQLIAFSGPIHYKDNADNITELWKEIDTSVVSSSKPDWDWEVTKGLWHLRGKDDTTVALGRDGHWIGFRLDGIAYLDVVTKQYEILQSRQSVVPIVSNNKIRWEDLFYGVNLEYTYTEDRFRENVEVTQVARDWLSEHPPSSYGLNNQDTYLTFYMSCDWKNAPNAESENGTPINWNAGWESENRTLKFRHKVKDYIVAMLPISRAVHQDDELSIDTIPIRKRFFRQGDKNWLLFGSSVIKLNQIPPGTIIFDPDTFYPDDDPETSSVDGTAYHQCGSGAGVDWGVLVGNVGTGSDDDPDYFNVYIYSDTTGRTNKWRWLFRPVVVVDVSGLPVCTVTATTLSLYGYIKADGLSIAPDVNVYSSAPALNTAVAAGDYDSFGTSPYCDTPITYANWNTGDPGAVNDFVFNATGIAAVQTASDGNTVVKLGLRNANYDVAEELDPGNHSPAWTASQGSYMYSYTADKGGAHRPKLVVTYVTGPTVVTNNATSVEETTTTLSANITGVGGGNATERGFEWDIDSGAPYSTNWTEGGNWGVCQFTHGATGLTEGELYYYRGMAKTAAGWGYGGEVTFFTKPAEPNSLSATAVNSTQVDLTWVKGAGADNTTIRGKDGSYADNISDGYQVYNGTGTSASDTGLACSHTYYYRAWSWATEGGLEHYSDLYAQDNELAPCLPTVFTTAGATNILSSGGTLSGNITATGGQNADYRSFEWGNACDNYTDNWTEGGSFGVSYFSRAVSGLSSNTTYFFRAMAHNVAGWGYGSCENFTTLAPTGIPDAPTNFTITQVGISSANLSWTKGFDADTTIIRVSTDGYPTTVTSGYSTYNSTGNSTLDTGLSLTLETYYYRTWSYNAFGYSADYAEGTIGGANMITIAAALIVLVFTILAFWKRDAVLYMLGTIGWLFMTFYLANQNYPAENAYLPFAMAGFCLSITLVMAVQTVRVFFGTKLKPPTSNEVQSEYKKKVLAVTRRRERKWWEEGG